MRYGTIKVFPGEMERDPLVDRVRESATTCGHPSLTLSTAKVRREQGKENRRGRRGGKGNQTFLILILVHQYKINLETNKENAGL